MKKGLNIPWLFWIELTPLFFVPCIIWYGNTPTNVLNASTYGKILEFFGIYGLQIISFSVLPLGIVGLALFKQQNKLRMATKILSIVNLSLGILMLLGIFVVICLMVFKGFSV